jgi:hypothetical protein
VFLSQQSSESFRGYPCVPQDLREQFRSNTLAVVDCEEQRAPVLVNEEAVAATPTRLVESRPGKSREHPAGG